MLSVTMEPFSLTAIYLRYVVIDGSVVAFDIILIKTAFLVTKCHRIEAQDRERITTIAYVCRQFSPTELKKKKNTADAIAEK